MAPHFDRYRAPRSKPHGFGMPHLEGPACALSLLAVTWLMAGPPASERRIEPAGPTGVQGRSVPPFDRVRVDVPARVRVTGGAETHGIELRGPSDLLAVVATEVAAGQLQVRLSRPVEDVKGLEIRIETPRLRDVSVRGEIRAQVEGVVAETFEVHSEGAAQVAVSGQVGRLEVRAEGRTTVETHRLTTRSATLRLTGSAEATVAASERLRVEVRGVGTVRYRGSPAIERSIRGIATLEPLGTYHAAPAPQSSPKSG